MPIINRNMDYSQSRDVLPITAGPTATGATLAATPIGFYSSLDAVQVMAFGVSGSPTVQLFINRFIPGTGFTAFSLTAAQAVPSFGTSGVIAKGYSLPQIGSTLTLLQPNDVVMVQTGGANSAVTGLCVGLVLRCVIDETQYFGIL